MSEKKQSHEDEKAKAQSRKDGGKPLSESQLDEVSGGLNPQPLPPIVIDKI